MQMASSAKRTCSELRSASLYTATVLMPSSLHAQMTRRAISPRLAMRIFRNMENFIRRGFTQIHADGNQNRRDPEEPRESWVPYGFLIRVHPRQSAADELPTTVAGSETAPARIRPAVRCSPTV